MRRLALLLFVACAPAAQLIRAPFDPVPANKNGPVNAAERGEVRFRDAEVFGVAGRPQAEKLMHDTCGGPYRIESEEPEPNASTNWKLVIFTCATWAQSQGH
jgi:hypothetical protein